MSMWCQLLLLLFIYSSDGISVRCCAVNWPISLFLAFPRKMVRQLLCSGLSRILSDPPGEARKGFLEEVMSTLRSQGGVGLARQSGEEEKERVQLAEGESSDSCRGLEANGNVDI